MVSTCVIDEATHRDAQKLKRGFWIIFGGPLTARLTAKQCKYELLVRLTTANDLGVLKVSASWTPTSHAHYHR